jgi:hypothetical protein
VWGVGSASKGQWLLESLHIVLRQRTRQAATPSWTIAATAATAVVAVAGVAEVVVVVLCGCPPARKRGSKQWQVGAKVRAHTGGIAKAYLHRKRRGGDRSEQWGGDTGLALACLTVEFAAAAGGDLTMLPSMAIIWCGVQCQ